MLNIDIICVGKLKEQYFKDANKINNSIINEIKTKECLKIKSKIKKDSYIISLDLNRKKFKFYSIFTKNR